MADQVTYGGQAVVEGVMMRGARFFAVACRRANGEILVRQEEIPAFFTRYKWARWPFLRGVFALADAMVLGMRSLMWSANLAMEDERLGPSGTPGPLTQALLGPLYLLMQVSGGGPIGSIAVTGSAFVGMAFGICLFMLAPSALAGLATPFVGRAWLGVVEGVVRVALVLSYIALIGRMKHVQRLFQYHGAEHQAINALEMEHVLDVDAAMRASRIHPRCGTNFILTVLLVKALIFTVLPWQPALLPRLGLRLLLLPIVGSLAYEVIRLAGKYRSFAPLQWLVWPGRVTQYLTTRVPAREMVEVAIASLGSVMEREGTLPAARVATAEVPAIV